MNEAKRRRGWGRWLGLCLAGFGLGLGFGPRLEGANFDAAPFGLALAADQGSGVIWEDPREVHEVVVHFAGAAPRADRVKVQYWGSWWPERHLPKDREPGGGDIGWLELGNWWKYEWRDADAVAEVGADGASVRLRFRPVNAREFPKVTDYPAEFRYTLKLRVKPEAGLPAVRRIEARTDSEESEGLVRLVWAESGRAPEVEVFNGGIRAVRRVDGKTQELRLSVVVNPDPNTFDRTLVTVRRGRDVFTFRWDDLRDGALQVAHLGVAVLPEPDRRSYAEVAAEQAARGARTLRQRVSAMPEQTWTAARAGMPPKKSDIYFPMGLDGGRQRFRVWADGRVDFRHNDEFLKGRPGADTPRLAESPGPVVVRFGLSDRPEYRTLADTALPILTTRWTKEGLSIEQTAFVTELGGMRRELTAPEGDTLTVWMARFTVKNGSGHEVEAPLPLEWMVGDRPATLRSGVGGWLEDDAGGRVWTSEAPVAVGNGWGWQPRLAAGATWMVELKVPYLPLKGETERGQLRSLDVERERGGVERWWRERLEAGARLRTPEPMLNEFHRSVAMHLLVNCEREPGAARRFARVGSFSYGAYGNESCMMVQDLERRGYHREAQECLDAWLRYQGTVELPGSFGSKDGVLYGAGGYEAGGYNQHHGWILWMLGEHYRFTRDERWLREAAPGIVQGAEWILRETARTADRHPLERGLLPAGSLEDIGDWWTWLSTSCYTWRGLDNAAWALSEIGHPEAARLRRAAAEYHRALLANFRAARERSPVVRLRDGTAVPKIPSQVHRRGRSFGWICETLEGPLHLLITRALDARSREATWILDDYEDNLFLSNQYGYTVPDFEGQWFSLGGMSMQACLLLQVEPWLYRDDVKQALRGLFNAQAASYFPTVRMNTEHALPELGDWRGDHFKSSDEANCSGWLRQLFVREEDEATLLIGQAVPRDWLADGKTCGIDRTATWFGPVSVSYTGGREGIEARLEGPTRNPPKHLRLRFREAGGRPLRKVTVNGKDWKRFAGEWVELPGGVGTATVVAEY